MKVKRVMRAVGFFDLDGGDDAFGGDGEGEALDALSCPWGMPVRVKWPLAAGAE